MPDRPVSSSDCNAILRRHDDFIGQELHDTVCQTLAAVSLTMSSLKRQHERGKDLAYEDLEKIHKNVDAAAEQLRLIFEGGLLEQYPQRLLPMLQRLAAATTRRAPCSFSVDHSVAVTEGSTAYAFYSTARIFVHLALQAGEARRIKMTLAREKKLPRLRLSFEGAPILSPTFASVAEKILEDAMRCGCFQWRVEAGTQLVCGPL